MNTYEGAVFTLCLIIAILACIRCIWKVNQIDDKIDSICAEEKRQNQRIDVIERREQSRQANERYNREFINSKDLFSKW